MATTVSAENPDDFETILLPISFAPWHTVEGAFGTLWRMELWFHNGSDRDVLTFQPLTDGFCVPVPCSILAPAGKRGIYFNDLNNEGGNGAFLHVSNGIRDRISFSARLLETSRMAQPTGVALPIVRESEFLAGPSDLLGIPSGPGIRSALRVYDPVLQRGSAVIVDVIDEQGNVIATKVLYPGNHPAVPVVREDRFYNRPGVDAIMDLAAEFPILATHDRFHLRLRPLQEGVRYWAFVSVTHNDTQHVLLITP